MSVCSVCLEPFFPEPISRILKSHVKRYLREQQRPFATEKDRTQALASYLTHRTQFSNLLTSLQSSGGCTLREARIYVNQWKSKPDLWCETVTLYCNHSLHRSCASQLYMQSYVPVESEIFALLPRLPRLQEGSISCPICRQVTEKPATDNYKPPGFGPYGLAINNLVWYYWQEREPGHEEAGNIGRVIQYDQNATLFQIQPLVPKYTDVVSVPVCQVFPLSALSHTGIPSREEVNRCRRACHFQTGLVTELFSLKTVITWNYNNQQVDRGLLHRYHMLRETLADVKHIRQIQNELPDISLWFHRIWPRLGCQGPRNQVLLPPNTHRGLWSTFEDLARKYQVFPNQVAVSWSYAQSGWSHDGFLSALLHPEFHVGQLESPLPPLPTWCKALGIRSEAEYKRIVIWAHTTTFEQPEVIGLDASEVEFHMVLPTGTTLYHLRVELLPEILPLSPSLRKQLLSMRENVVSRN